MRRLSLHGVVAASAFLLGAAFLSTADEDAIRAVRAASNRAIAERDLEALQDTWLEELHVVASSGEAIDGGVEMARLFAESFEDPEFVTYVRTPDTVTVSESANFAAEEGRWVGTWNRADGTMSLRGRYLAQWQKREGSWRIRAEVFVALACDGSSACSERR